jgi:hypothetical protein
MTHLIFAAITRTTDRNLHAAAARKADSVISH